MILAALLLGAQAPAATPSDSLAFDMRCMILTGQLRESTDANIRAAGEGASYYFFGRVDGRIPDAELEERLWRISQTLRDDERAANFQACGRFMEERGRVLVGIGDRLQARERSAPSLR